MSPINDLDSRMAAFNPVPAGDEAGEACSAEAAALLRRVLAGPGPAVSHHRPRARLRPSRRAWSMAAAGAAAATAVVAAVTLLVPAQRGGQPAAGGHPASPVPAASATPDMSLVDFSVSHGTITARITDPLAAASQLSAVFRAHGLNIDVSTLPVSPSLVGKIVATDAPVISALWDPACSEAEDCTVGLVIPASFTGRASVIVGRPGRPGEHYESQADAFGAGEVLHCSGLLGQPAAAALPVLRRLHLRATWFAHSGDSMSSDGTNRSTPSGYIVDGNALSSSVVSLDTVPSLPLPRDWLSQDAQLNHGCP